MGRAHTRVAYTLGGQCCAVSRSCKTTEPERPAGRWQSGRPWVLAWDRPRPQFNSAPMDKFHHANKGCRGWLHVGSCYKCCCSVVRSLMTLSSVGLAGRQGVAAQAPITPQPLLLRMHCMISEQTVGASSVHLSADCWRRRGMQ